MPTNFLSDDDQTCGPLHRMEAEFETLNARIARLAIALGVALEHDQQICDILQSNEPHGSSSAQRRRQWTELRGLLVLRYGLERNYAAQFGAETLKRILIDAEEHLTLLGFKPGADGVHIKQLFGNG